MDSLPTELLCLVASCLQRDALLQLASTDVRMNKALIHDEFVRIQHLIIVSDHKLELNHRCLTDISMQHMLPSLPITLMELYLEGNRIGDDGCSHIVASARGGTWIHLQIMDLAKNMITDVGCCRILDICRKLGLLESIWTLRLFGNHTECPPHTYGIIEYLNVEW